ncbi:MAG: hypothetical protein NZ954_05560 [Thermofilaceae archaeon]|nr:hypothetical protein [Thermofilaceae archaeon]MCX8180965.1 hypothetical protein [Thermofilaceae archaeon]MDW8004070.1 hypothetical protein [Thermofilaceae archaeon]
MKFTELLDRLVYPTGTLIKRGFERVGYGDPDEIILDSPSKFLEKLAELMNEEYNQARLFIYLSAKVLEDHGVYIDAERWLRAFESDDKTFISEWLDKLDSFFFSYPTNAA